MKLLYRRDTEFLVRMLRQFARDIPAGAIGVALTSVFLASILLGHFPPSQVLPWAGFMVTLALSRLLFRTHYLQDCGDKVYRYLNLLNLNMVLTAVGWAALSIFLLDFNNVPLFLVTALFIIAMAATSITSLAGFTCASLLYVNIALWPLIIRTANSDIVFGPELAIATAVCDLFLMSAAVKLARNIHSNVEQAIEARARESFIRQVIDSSENAIITLDRHGRIFDWNHTAESLLGWTFKEAHGRTIAELLPFDKADDFFGELIDLNPHAQSERAIDAEISNKFNRQLNVQLVIKPVLGSQSERYHLDIHDKTEQVKQDKVLKEAEARARNLLNTIDIGIVELDTQGIIQFANLGALNLLGYEGNSLVGKHFHQQLVYQDEDLLLRESTESAIADALDQDTPKQFAQLILRHRSGQKIYVTMSIIPFTRDERHRGAIVSMIDISESFRVLQDQKRLLQISESIPEMMFTFSVDGHLLSINKAARDVFAIGNQALDRNIKLQDLFEPAQLRRLQHEAIPTALTDDHWAGETILNTPGAGELDVSMYLMKLRDDEHTQYYALIMSDITERNLAQERLLEAKDEAEAAARAKAEFLATMSHEIRTPLNGVMGMAQLLEQTELNQEQEEFVSAINDSGKSLLSIINNVLDFSKIGAGRLQLELIEFDLERVCYDICSLLLPKANSKGIELILNYPADCPHRVRGDAGRLRQILLNLVGNAIKFTDKGHILVQVQPVNKIQSDNSIQLEFSVTDTGVGIPHKHQPRLFESFTQADGSTTRKYGGTGLGLSISKQLVNLMGGDIGLHSSPGKGAKFYFFINMEVVEATPPAQPDSLHGLRVMLIDDNSLSIRVLQGQLEHFGMQVYATTRTQHALEVLRVQARYDQAIELIIVDDHMPEMEGAELGAMIIADQKIPACPLVAYTSSPNRGDALRFENIGFLGYLARPSLSSMIHDLLDYVMLEFKRTPAEKRSIVTKYDLRHDHRTQRSTPDLAGLKLLLAEDNPVNQRVAQSILEKQNISVTVAVDGQQAVEYFESEPDFDVILMDCQMPVMDGYAATQEIQRLQAKREKSIPIIALTANASVEDRKACIEAGMDDFIAKPFNSETLIDKIHQYVSTSGSVDLQPRSTSAGMDALDLQVVNGLIEIMGDDFNELLSAYRQSSEELLAGLLDPEDPQDFKLMQRYAHSLKSSSANIGAINLSAQAEQLEKLFRKREPAEPDQLRALADEYQRVKQALLTLTTEEPEVKILST